MKAPADCGSGLTKPPRSGLFVKENFAESDDETQQEQTEKVETVSRVLKYTRLTVYVVLYDSISYLFSAPFPNEFLQFIWSVF